MLQTSWNIHNTGRFVSYSLDVKILSDEVKVIIEVLRFESKSSYMILNSLKTFIIIIIIIIWIKIKLYDIEFFKDIYYCYYYYKCMHDTTHTHTQTNIYIHTHTRRDILTPKVILLSYSKSHTSILL